MFYTLWLPQQYGLNRFPCVATTTVWDEPFTSCGYCNSMGVNLLPCVATTTVCSESLPHVATKTAWGGGVNLLPCVASKKHGGEPLTLWVYHNCMG